MTYNPEWNPYWEAVRHAVKNGEYHWETPNIGRFEFERGPDDPPTLSRNDFVGRYTWTVTDPPSVEFVAEHAHGLLVDPMAGTGYWAYVLEPYGVDTACYDLDPEENFWHKNQEHWVPIKQMDGADSVRLHAGRTLLLSWPPYSKDVGHRIVTAYQGERVIYIGEGEGGCTGDEALHDELDGDGWSLVTTHRPIQWYGIHDDIYVYQRVST